MRQIKKSTRPGIVPATSLQRRLKEAAFIALIGLAAFFLLALATYHSNDPGWSATGSGGAVLNLGGPIGAWFADVLLYLFGYIAYLVPLSFIYAGWILFRERGEVHEHYKQLLIIRSIGFVLTLLAGAGLFSLHINASPNYMPFSAGGIIGSLVGAGLAHVLNNVGGSLLLLAGFFCGVTLATGLSWMKVMDYLGIFAIWLGNHSWQQLMQAKEKWQARKADQVPFTVVERNKPSSSVPAPKPVIVEPPVIAKPTAVKINTQQPEIQTSKRAEQERQGNKFETHEYNELPALSLLDSVANDPKKGFSKEVLQQLSQLVESKLKEFNVQANVVAVHPGPVITRFELDLAAGTKVSRLTNLQKDLARSLSVTSVRIVEVIPGKTYVGLEIPNENREIVRLGEILESRAFDEAKSPLSLALGKDIAGNPFVVDLAKMPHLLVAGTTGSGKSVGLNAMLLSILYKSTPEEVRLIMIDPKMLELSVYDGIPHLLTPVIVDMREAANALRWAIHEMDRRYRLMSALGVRNLEGYNHKVKTAIEAKKPLGDPLWPKEAAGEAPSLEVLPCVVVLVDEFADMMMVVGKKVEELIARLAQKARAAGIHLILATQRPSVDVITGLIKANVPTRISFQVSSRIDSRTILDQQGAEQLLGHGDMLYMGAGGGVPVRVHGAYVADEEVHKVVKDLKARSKPSYLMEIVETTTMPGEAGSERDSNELDPLFDEAVQVILDTQRASISNVQRRLKIGYNRAARILEEMEAQGIVSPMESNGSREILAQQQPGE